MTQENNTEQTTQSLEFGASCTSPVFYRVAVPSPLRRAFDYLPPKVGALAAQPGTRIRIPFGARKVTGVILDIVTETDVPPAKLRHADSVLDAAPLFSPELLALLRWAADYYQCPIGEVFAAALPARLRAGESIEAAQERWRAPQNEASKQEQDAACSLLSRSPRQLALYTLLLNNEIGRAHV